MERCSPAGTAALHKQPKQPAAGSRQRTARSLKFLLPTTSAVHLLLFWVAGALKNTVLMPQLRALKDSDAVLMQRSLRSLFCRGR